MEKRVWLWVYLHWNAGCNDETTCMQGGSMGDGHAHHANIETVGPDIISGGPPIIQL